MAARHRRRSYRNDETGHRPGHRPGPALALAAATHPGAQLSRLTSVQYSNTDCSEEEEIMNNEG